MTMCERRKVTMMMLLCDGRRRSCARVEEIPGNDNSTIHTDHLEINDVKSSNGEVGQRLPIGTS
jgi:hypothetical protein